MVPGIPFGVFRTTLPEAELDLCLGVQDGREGAQFVNISRTPGAAGVMAHEVVLRKLWRRWHPPSPKSEMGKKPGDDDNCYYYYQASYLKPLQCPQLAP